MCTFTYIPLANNGFIMATNRDESTSRLAALIPSLYLKDNFCIYFPQDPHGKGTWIATSQYYTLCLLNGGKAKHEKKSFYKKSRGLVLLEILIGLLKGEISPENTIDIKGIEPFTLFIVQHQPNALYKWVYSEDESMEISELANDKPHIHSSTTLYDEATSKLRAEWFEDFLEKSQDSEFSKLVDFHSHTNADNKEFGLRIDRKGITKTLSLSGVEYTNNHKMHHIDFITNFASELECIF